MRLKSVLAVAGLALALSQLTSVNAAFVGSFSGNDNDLVTVRDNLIAEGYAVECESLVLLVKWGFDREGGLEIEGVNDGLYADRFNVTGLTDDNKLGGTWSLKDGADLGGFNIVAYAAKGGNGYNLFTPEGPGPYSWNTIGIPNGNPNGNPNGTYDPPGLSHLSIFACQSVPEPGSILAGIAALGMFALGRKRLA